MSERTIDPDLLEHVVREVIRRLLERGIDVSGAPEDAELVIGDRVVSLPTVAGRLDGVRRLVIAMQAIVTPAVKDELRQRGIEVVRKDTS